MNISKFDTLIRRLSVLVMVALGVGLCGFALALYGSSGRAKPVEVKGGVHHLSVATSVLGK